MIRKELTKEKALGRLESLCSRSEQCEYDLTRKLLNWGLTSSVRTEILESLKENKFLDNARFAKSYANDKAKFAYWGPQKIRAELIKRRINSDMIKDALANIPQDVWKEGLIRCVSSKGRNFDLIGEAAWENRKKLFHYLISRGFPSAAANKAINYLKKNQEENG